MDETLLLSLGIFAGLAVLYFIYEKFNTKKRTPVVIYTTPKKGGAGAAEGDDSKPKVTILYGSQTGTAEMFATQMGKEGKKFGFNVQVMDLMDYETGSLEDEKILMFVVATYGEGEPTDSAREFYDWFDGQEAGMLDLSDLRYAVFGLGDSQYKIYNAIGKNTDAKLEELGAQRAFPLGLGDADKSLEEDFENWKAKAWPELSKQMGTEMDAGYDSFALERSSKIVAYPESPMLQQARATWTPFPLKGPLTSSFGPRDTAQRPLMCPIIEKRELLQDAGDRSTLHVEIDVSKSNWAFESGDHAAIYAPNTDETVREYLGQLDMMGHSEDTVISVIRLSSGTNQFPTRCTVYNAIKWYLDLTYAPKKETLKAFSNFVEDEEQKNNMQRYLAHTDEAMQKYKRLVEHLRNTYGWMRKFDSMRIPLDVFLEVMPRVAPRYYSIASDSLHPDQKKSVHVCAAIMQGGLVTPHLARSQVGDPVCMYVRRSNFHVPKSPSTPLLMVGPGTGIAPLVGFLWRRRALKASGSELGPCMFYFGCRSRGQDYLYQQLLEECAAEGVISHLRLAFSRDQAQKVYVQHLVAEDSEAVFRTLYTEKGSVYICGDAKNMARDVESQLKQTLQTHEPSLRESEAAEAYLEEMSKKERYLKDVWSTHT